MDNVKLELIEAKAGTIVDMGYSDSYSPPVVVRLAEETLDLVAEVRSLRARLEAVCDVVSDAAAYGDDIAATRVLEAVRGEREVRQREISFDEIQAGDFLRVSFPARGGLSDNWSIEHSRTAIAYHKHDADFITEWMTSDGQMLVNKMLHDTAKIELLSRLG